MGPNREGFMVQRAGERVVRVSRSRSMTARGLHERIVGGETESLAEADLLAALLGARSATDNVAVAARRLIEEGPGLRYLDRAGVAELCSVPGMNRMKVVRLKAFIALAKRFGSEAVRPGARIRSSSDIFRHYRCRLRDVRKEKFITLLLDGKNRVIREEKISEGSLTASIVHPREVFMPAIRESARSIVLVHNHPSGDPTPSFEDIEVTQRLIKVGEVVGIRVLEHVIIGEDAFVSFVDRGLLTGTGF